MSDRWSNLRGLAQAQAQPSVPVPVAPSQNLPDLIKQAGALNLGGTSFYDGFGRLDEGVTFLQYFHYADLSNSTLANGAPNRSLNQPPVFADDTTSGPQINLQLIHKFGAI